MVWKSDIKLFYFELFSHVCINNYIFHNFFRKLRRRSFGRRKLSLDSQLARPADKQTPVKWTLATCEPVSWTLTEIYHENFHKNKCVLHSIYWSSNLVILVKWFKWVQIFMQRLTLYVTFIYRPVELVWNSSDICEEKKLPTYFPNLKEKINQDDSEDCTDISYFSIRHSQP